MQVPLTVTTQQDLDGRLAAAAFHAIALRDRLHRVRRTRFPAAALTLDELLPLGDVELAERRDGRVDALLRLEPGMIVYLTASRGSAELAVAGRDHEAVDSVTDAFVAALRDREQKGVPFTFWAAAAGGVSGARRRLDAPPWPAIAANYAPPTRERLTALTRATEPGDGRLLLFHGEPGTGKSYALRALARAWQPWCEAHFITDPDTLLGSRGTYLLNTLLREGGLPWRLLVLEDAGELLAADARAQAGQALSRLLNLTDGLLGDGLRSLVLVTTNEPLRRLHEAVVRPGRCWEQVEFPPLPAPDADAWLADRGAAAAGREATLAELFALADGREVARARGAVGFSPGR